MRRLLISSSLLLLLFVSGCSKRETPEQPVREPHRSLYHFTPPSGWMNDPNGMVYYEGTYHLFYQHYPDSTVWGPMHWGHATSTDMLHWTHQPIALFPDSLGMIFSGSAVADLKNTSGLGTTENPPLVAIYTYHEMSLEKSGQKDFQYQGMAYSLDKGNAWKKYENNPVLKGEGRTDFRDPKVIWHEPSSQWVMILAVKDHVEFYRSPDLKAWTYAGSFGESNGSHAGVWECPDLFELNIDNTDQKKWVMLLSINPGAPNGGSGTQYFIGDFDGHTFTTSLTDTLWMDLGKDNYAGVTWSNIPETDGRRLFIGWMSNWQYGNVVPTEKWRSAMTIPRELKLVTTDTGPRLASIPVKELTTLQTEAAADGNWNESVKLPSSTVRLDMVLKRANASDNASVTFFNAAGEEVVFGIDGGTNRCYMDRSKSGATSFSTDFLNVAWAPRASHAKDVKVSFYLDVASLEVFADDGTTTMTTIFFPTHPMDQVKVEGGAVDQARVQTVALE